MVRPPRLRAGDTVAVVATSWGGPTAIPHVYERGLDVLRRVFELEVRELQTTRMAPAALRADPRARADDLNAAFADPSIRAISVAIGGDDAVRILPFLDPSLALAAPNTLSAFSYTVTQLPFYSQAGLVTFNGPSVRAGFAQIEVFPGAADHIRSVLFTPVPSLEYRPFEAWVDGYANWGDPANAGAVG